MKINKLSLLILSGLLSFGCSKPLAQPESVDPVYRDLKKEALKAYGSYKEKEKAALDAKKAFEKAPIRTGERLNLQEEYFNTLKTQDKFAEKYRYLALKAELRKKQDRNLYPDYFKNKKPWPDREDFESYEVEKRLANAPKEWNPESRIKERALSSLKKVAPSESEGHE